MSLPHTESLPFIAAGIALLVSSLIAYPVFRMLLALKSRQTISQYLGESHQVKQGTPTMGGIITILGATASMLICGTDWRIISLFVGFAFIGFADDFIVPRLFPGKRGLGWIPKLVMQTAVCVFIFMNTPQMTSWNIAVATFLILFMANAYNFADGLDGLAGGLFLLLALGLGMIFFTLHSIDGGTAILSRTVVPLGAIAGGMLPFLYLNRRPAKVFMGDVGSLPIGAILGMVAALFVSLLIGRGSYAFAFTRDNPAHTWGGFVVLIILFFVMIAELVPVPLQILSVKLRKGKRLFARTPIHHAFEFYGWPEARITRFFFLIQFSCVILSTVIYWVISHGGKP